jgi:hypothetical protein
VDGWDNAMMLAFAIALFGACILAGMSFAATRG